MSDQKADGGAAVPCLSLLDAVLAACVEIKAESDAIPNDMGAAVQSDVCHVLIKVVNRARTRLESNPKPKDGERGD